jgi:glycosyltransferase involved in cell wall biosynthesis
VRVLILVDRPTLAGGGERLAVQTAARLNPDRFEITFCATRWDPSEQENPMVSAALADLRAAGVSLLGLSRRSTADVRPWLGLVRELRRRRIEVLHAHKFGSNVWGAAVGRLAGVPVIIAHEHTWSYAGRPLRRFIDRQLIARGSDAFLAVSQEDMRRMVALEGIDPRDVLVVPNGIPLAQPTGRNIRRELGIPLDAPVVGSVGRLYRQKALEVLMQATATLVQDFPQLQVIVVGEGPERASLAELADRLGISGTVRLVGLRDDVPDILAVLDVAVSCSDWEGSPLSVMEYMAAGLPTVATAVGGVPGLIVDGVHGRLVPPRDPAALADAIAGLLRAPATRAEMGRRARERQQREFDLEVLVGRLERLYTDLVASRVAGRPRREAARSALAGQRPVALPRRGGIPD